MLQQALLSIMLMVLTQEGAVGLHGQLATPRVQHQSLLAAAAQHDVVPTGFKGSSFVPIDSWIYPALDRLAALGYLPTSSTTIRPLTRLECARLVEEGRKIYSKATQGNERVEGPLDALSREFAHELKVIEGKVDNAGGMVEGVYARYTGISGTPLRDSFHFSQTIPDDFGRPYGQGSNAITGVSGYAERGPFALYVRGEYQHGASNVPYSASAQQAIVSYDESEAWTTAPGAPLPGVFNYNPASASRPRFIEAYAALNLANWQISAGQQSLWWGPDRSTSLILSNNAAAMPMIRIARATPLYLPGFLRKVGPIHFDAFLARQGGIHYVALGPTFILHGDANSAITPPPYLWGATFSIEPTRNIEMSLAHTTIFAGYGRPLNLETFVHSFSMLGNTQAVDPGKRVTEVNFSYHVPWLRHRLVAYTEAMAWDDPIQGHFTERFALAPGLYLPQLPYFKKLDLRLEGAYTDLPGLKYVGYFYSNAHYPQGYTNYGQVLGSWVGRDGRGGQGTSTYWFSSRTKASATYRKMVADRTVLNGGNLTAVSGSFSWLVNPQLELSTTQQYERWHFPVLNQSPQSNFSTIFQIQVLSRPKL